MEQKNRILASFVFFLVAFPAYADFKPLAVLSKGEVIFHDLADPQRFLALNGEGQSRFFSEGQFQKQVPVKVASPECAPQKLLEAKFAFPYFVALDRICVIENDSLTLLLVETPPENAYSVTYFGEEENWDYFLINGRPWEALGYVKLRAIHKKTRETKLRDLVIEVPGYSAGMWMEPKDLYVTIWEGTNDVFQFDTAQIWKAIQSQTTLQFTQIAKKVAGPLTGLSLAMFGGDEDFLFYNLGHASYTVHRSKVTQTKIAIPKECRLIAPMKSEWVISCTKGEETEIRKGTF